MGADLYIKNMDRKAQYTGFEVSESARNKGYFRDCYNGYGLFAVMTQTLGKTFSWWQLVDRKDLPWVKDEGRELGVEGLKLWLAELEPEIQRFLQAPKLYAREYRKDKDGQMKLANGEAVVYKKPLKKAEMKEYHDWAKGLLDFIRLAIAKQSPVIFSC